MKTVSKEFLKNSFSFSRYRLLKSRNSAGQILGFHRFPKIIFGKTFVSDVTGDLSSRGQSWVIQDTILEVMAKKARHSEVCFVF